MDFEFQISISPDNWQSLDIVATPGNRFDVEEAAVGLRDLRDGHLPTGSYRVRPVKVARSDWIQAEVDDHGVFRRLS